MALNYLKNRAYNERYVKEFFIGRMCIITLSIATYKIQHSNFSRAPSGGKRKYNFLGKLFFDPLKGLDSIKVVQKGYQLKHIDDILICKDKFLHCIII